MQIYFIRHGESTNNLLFSQNRDYHRDRTTDPELTERGQQQAALLADRLSMSYSGLTPRLDYQNHAGFGLTHIYCSLMVRAIDTAMPTAKALGLPLSTLPMIHEFGGIFEFEGTEKRIGLAGLTRDQLLSRYPNLHIDHLIAEAGWWDARDEDSAELYRRAQEAVDLIIANHDDDDRVAIVSHGGFYQAFMARMLQIELNHHYPDPRRHLNFFINNAAITRFEKKAGRVNLYYHNDTSHLSAELVSH